MAVWTQFGTLRLRNDDDNDDDDDDDDDNNNNNNIAVGPNEQDSSNTLFGA